MTNTAYQFAYLIIWQLDILLDRPEACPCRRRNGQPIGNASELVAALVQNDLEPLAWQVTVDDERI